MAKSFTVAQLKELRDIHENTIIKFFANRFENLESKVISMQEENKQLKSEVKAQQESIEFRNETYGNIKKDLTEEKQKLETDNRNNEFQKLIKQNTEIRSKLQNQKTDTKEIIYEGIKEKSRVESETWEESKAKVKVFRQEKLGLETDEITIDRAHRIGKKREKEGPLQQNF